MGPPPLPTAVPQYHLFVESESLLLEYSELIRVPKYLLYEQECLINSEAVKDVTVMQHLQHVLYLMFVAVRLEDSLDLLVVLTYTHVLLPNTGK